MSRQRLTKDSGREQRYASVNVGVSQQTRDAGALHDAPATARPCQARRLASLLEVNKRLAVGATVQEILARITDEAVVLLDAAGAWLRLVDEDGPSGAATVRPDGSAIDESQAGIAEILEGQVAAAGCLRIESGQAGARRSRRIGRVEKTVCRSWLRVPVQVGDRRIGVLVVLSRVGRRLAEADLELLQAFADQAALAIENSRRSQQAAARADRMSRFAEMSRSAGESLDVEKLQDLVVGATAELVAADRTSLWLVEEGNDTVVLAAASDRRKGPTARRAQATRERLPLEGSAVGRVVATGQWSFTPDLQREPLQLEQEARLIRGFRSRLIMPLRAESGVMGALTFSYRRCPELDSDEIELLQAFAAQATTAINNARLYRQVSRRREQAEAMAEIARATASSLELHEVLALALDKILEIMGVPSGIMYLRDEVEDDLRVAAHRGLSAAYIADVDHVQLGEGALGRVALTGRAELIDDVVTHPNIVRPAVRREGIHSMVIVPLQARDRVIGAVYVAYRVIQPFTAEQTSLLVELGQQVAVAIENARLHGAAVRRGRELATLLRATRTVMAGLDLQVILKQIAEEAAHIADTPHVEVLLVEDEGSVLRSRAAVGGSARAGSEVPVGSGLSGTVAATGQSLFVPDIRNHAENPLPGHQAGPVTYLGLPIKVRERVVGVLVFNTLHTDRYSQAELDYLSWFADQSAIAIDNARLFEQVATVEALRELTRLKTEFLSTVSHELRTPLTLIVGYSELLATRAARLSAEAVAEMAGQIGEGSRTMVRLVDDLLDFARLEQGKVRFRRQRVAVGQLLGRLVDSFRREPGGKAIALEAQEGLEAYLDPERFTQVVNNLIANALRYAPGGPIHVTVARRKGQLRVEVADRGPGIPPEEQARIWEKFYRGSGGVYSPHRGSGLGLAVVKHLVELHGGRVGVRSIVGQGSTFWFTIPVEPARAASPRSTTETPLGEAPAGSSVSNPYAPVV